jgi:hypothetical protein
MCFNSFKYNINKRESRIEVCFTCHHPHADDDVPELQKFDSTCEAMDAGWVEVYGHGWVCPECYKGG